MTNNIRIYSMVSIVTASLLLVACGGGGSSGGSNSSSSSIIASSSTSSELGSSTSSELGSSTSSELSSSTSSESSSLASMVVRVCDAYVLGATVKAGDYVFELEHDDGRYEIARDDLGSLILTSDGGVNDLNGDNELSTGEPFAPNMKAPAGYSHISPFTTMVVNGVNIAAQSDYQSVAHFAPLYDFDVVVEGENFANGIAQATAIAALRLSAGGDGSMQQASSSSQTIVDDSLPGAGGSSSLASSSSAQSISSITSSVASSPGGSILPQALALRGILPGGEDGSSSTSSIRSSSSSSVSSIVASSSSTVSSSSSSSVSSVVDLLQEAINAIKNAKNMEELTQIIKEYMVAYNGVYGVSSSSNSVAGSSLSSSTSVIGTPDDCLPGFDCAVSSSSIQLSSSVSSSSKSSSSVNSAQQTCIANGGTWIAEVNGCQMPPASSSLSSSRSSSNGGPVLPE